MITRNKILILCLIVVLSILLVFTMRLSHAELNNTEYTPFTQNETANSLIAGNDTVIKEQNGSVSSGVPPSTYEVALYQSLSELESKYKATYESNHPNSSHPSNTYSENSEKLAEAPKETTSETTSIKAYSPAPTTSPPTTQPPEETPLAATYQLPLPAPIPTNSSNILQYGAATAGTIVATASCFTTVIVLRHRSHTAAPKGYSKKSKGKNRSRRKAVPRKQSTKVQTRTNQKNS